MSLIKPTLPALIGPTFKATVDPGGAPWERRPGGAPVAAWLPSDITGVAEWWRADLGVTDAGGGAVSAWQGQIAGQSVTQGTAGARPTLTTLDSQSVLLFDGGDYLQGASPGVPNLSQPNTAVVVLQQTSNSPDLILDSASGLNRNAVFANGVTEYDIRSDATGGSGVAPDTSPHVIVGVFNSPSSAIYVDNLATPAASGLTTGTETWDGLTIGAGVVGTFGLNGYVWEVIRIDGVISAGDLAELGAYLDARYAGLSLTY